MKNSNIAETGDGAPAPFRPPLVLVFSITVSGILANTLINAPLPDILEHFDQPDSAGGFFVTAAALPGVVMAPVIGLLADRHGRRRVLVPCLLAFGLFGLLAGLAPSWTTLLLARLGQGIGAAGLINLAVVLIGDFWSGIDRARVIGYNAAVLTASLAVFPAIGGGLAQWGGWRWAFAPYVLALGVAYAVNRMLPGDVPHAGDAKSVRAQLRDAGQVIKQPLVATAIAYGFVLFILIFGLFLTVLPIYLDDQFGLEAGGRGLIIAVPAAASTLAALSLGRLRRRFGAGALVILGSLLFSVAFVLIGLAGALAVVVLGAIVYGLGEGLSLATLQDLVAGAAPDETRGAVVAVWVAAVRAGQAVGPLIAAAGLAWVGAGASFVIAATVPLLLFAALMVSPMRTVAADP